MKKNNVISLPSRDGIEDLFTTLLRDGAKHLIHQAVEAELDELLSGCAERQTADGKAGVVRNGHLPEQSIQTGIGPVRVSIPKVRAKDGQPITFRSALMPPYVRKTQSLEAALPWLYLKGISTGQMEAALKVLVGPEAQGLSASVVARLKQTWADEYQAWCKQDLSQDQWVYLGADGIDSGLRSDDVKLCALVIIGVNERGEKHFLAIEDGTRESTQSWREVLLDLQSRGMNSPTLAVGDGALGFWAALDEVCPTTRHQRCWLHKSNNVLNCFPKSSQPKVKTALHAIWQAETKHDADKAFDLFIKTYDAKYPKATLCLQKDRGELLAFYDFPETHWQSIRTTNPIESTFGTIRHRTKRSKGCLTRDGMLQMMFKLGQCAEKNWRRLRGFNDLGKVIAGVEFKDGIEVTEDSQSEAA